MSPLPLDLNRGPLSAAGVVDHASLPVGRSLNGATRGADLAPGCSGRRWWIPTLIVALLACPASRTGKEQRIIKGL